MHVPLVHGRAPEEGRLNGGFEPVTRQGDRPAYRPSAPLPARTRTAPQSAQARPFACTTIRVVAFLAMRKPSETHEQLISLQRLCLDGRALEFRQAFLSLRAQDGLPMWSCTLRGVSADELGRLEGELRLRAQALDGRTIEGRVAAPGSPAPFHESPTVVELAGLGALLSEGREL
jgi:hypothetical protein